MKIQTVHPYAAAVGCAAILGICAACATAESTELAPPPPPPTFVEPADASVEPALGLDPTKDNDGDGFLFADDCDDRDPSVNPGALESKNGRDDDCDGAIDNVLDCTSWAGPSTFASRDPVDYARALGICRTTPAAAKGRAKTWGLVEAALTRTDGTLVEPERMAHFGILTRFGDFVLPREGTHLVAISTGQARTPRELDFDPRVIPNGWQPRAGGPPPPSFYAPSPGAPCARTFLQTNDVKLRLRVRVPTNVVGIRFDSAFYTHNYPAPKCGLAGDSFVALLDTAYAGEPSKKGNIVFDKTGGFVTADTSFLQSCIPIDDRAGYFGLGGKYDCPLGPRLLSGTGFDPHPDYPLAELGGATTGWLETRAPVVPGEIITLDFMVWGPSTNTVLVDNFGWEQSPTAPVTQAVK